MLSVFGDKHRNNSENMLTHEQRALPTRSSMMKLNETAFQLLQKLDDLWESVKKFTVPRTHVSWLETVNMYTKDPWNEKSLTRFSRKSRVSALIANSR